MVSKDDVLARAIYDLVVGQASGSILLCGEQEQTRITWVRDTTIVLRDTPQAFLELERACSGSSA